MRAVEAAVNFANEMPGEIHIIVGSASSVRFISRTVYLGIKVSQKDVDSILSALTGGALYAHRETLKEGFLTLGGGIRIGICGQARYEGGELMGVHDVSSLLIRIPCMECSFTDLLCDAFLKCERGLLIFAPPSGGKTTALRALVRRLAEIRAGRISVIDERREIECADFSCLDADVFKGYRRGEGMQIALRVMSPQILAVDEIGTSAESMDILESLLSGVKFIATAHGKNFEEIRKKKNLAVFFELGIFDVLAGIFNTDKGFECKIYENRVN